jgi:hypothetical protein
VSLPQADVSERNEKTLVLQAAQVEGFAPDGSRQAFLPEIDEVLAAHMAALTT